MYYLKYASLMEYPWVTMLSPLACTWIDAVAFGIRPKWLIHAINIIVHIHITCMVAAYSALYPVVCSFEVSWTHYGTS